VTALLSGYGGQQSQGEQFQKPFSEATAQALDQAGEQARTLRPGPHTDPSNPPTVKKMVTDAHTKTKKLLTEKKAEVEKVAKLLLEKEVITREDMRNCESRKVGSNDYLRR
jgi:AFG3 family protein